MEFSNFRDANGKFRIEMSSGDNAQILTIAQAEAIIAGLQEQLEQRILSPDEIAEAGTLPPESLRQEKTLQEMFANIQIDESLPAGSIELRNEHGSVRVINIKTDSDGSED